jgi:hypothetical protein
MPLLRASLLALLARHCAGAVKIRPCAAGAAAQAWSLTAPGDGLVASAIASPAPAALCLATADCAPSETGAVLLVPCGSTVCGAAAPNLRWRLDAQGRLASGASNFSLCVTLAAVNGPAVNLWPCAGAQSNAQWASAPAPSPPVPAGYVTLATRDAQAGFGCLDGGVGPGGVAVLNASAVGRRVYGIGGLAAIGGARLIYEYAEPVRECLNPHPNAAPSSSPQSHP